MRVNKALLVDSSRTMVKIIENIIKEEVVDEILIADSSDMALLMLDEHPDIDLVITEYHPPDLDGIELTTRIRANENFKDKYIIMATKEGHKRVVGSAMEAGCNDYIVRPFNASVLIAKINHMLRIKKHASTSA